ncbi:ferredoxin [Nonomuraea sp. NPDC052116]|uniref:ferredoxin n=1 Tax=Nonomuraea sp. NPDC052116 TaxID=3155665 RepID=UPI00342C4E01
MTTIKVDRSTCQGYGNCVLALASVFDLDEEGLVVLRRDDVEPGGLDGLRRAAYDCPTESITFVE